MAAGRARAIERNGADAEAAYASAPAGLKAELVLGMVWMAPAPTPRHQVLAMRLMRRLTPYDRRDGGLSDPRGWVFVREPELHLGERPDKLRPDLAAWRESRATFSLRDAAIAVAPDWVCEVLSPSTESFDRGTKAPVYAAHGVEWLWLVDPEAEVIEVFRNELGAFRAVRTLRGGGEEGGLPPMDAAGLAGYFEE